MPSSACWRRRCDPDLWDRSAHPAQGLDRRRAAGVLDVVLRRDVEEEVIRAHSHFPHRHDSAVTNTYDVTYLRNDGQHHLQPGDFAVTNLNAPVWHRLEEGIDGPGHLPVNTRVLVLACGSMGGMLYCYVMGRGMLGWMWAVRLSALE